MLPEPIFHEPSGAVRFWVLSDAGAVVGASIPKEVLHYRYRAQIGGSDALECYAANRDDIDAAVRRRIARGSIEPVMLREADVAPRRPA